jgi:hypothetical protein
MAGKEVNNDERTYVALFFAVTNCLEVSTLFCFTELSTLLMVSPASSAQDMLHLMIQITLHQQLLLIMSAFFIDPDTMTFFTKRRYKDPRNMS